MKGKFAPIVEDLFLFFTSHSNDVFKIHLELLVKNCKIYPKEIILKFLTEESMVTRPSLLLLSCHFLASLVLLPVIWDLADVHHLVHDP